MIHTIIATTGIARLTKLTSPISIEGVAAATGTLPVNTAAIPAVAPVMYFTFCLHRFMSCSPFRSPEIPSCFFRHFCIVFSDTAPLMLHKSDVLPRVLNGYVRSPSHKYQRSDYGQRTMRDSQTRCTEYNHIPGPGAAPQAYNGIPLPSAFFCLQRYLQLISE